MLRFIAGQSFPSEARGETCPECGGLLVAYVPLCVACGAPGASPVTAVPDLGKAPRVTRVLHLSDLHLGMSGQAERETFARWLKVATDTQVEVIAISGDLVHDPSRVDLLRTARGMLERTGLEWCVVPGNHDLPGPGGPGNFEEVFGSYPRVESLSGVEFILLDSNSPLPAAERTRPEQAFGRVVCFTEGRVGAEQMLRVDELLGAERRAPRVVLLHHHLVPQRSERVWSGVPYVTDELIGTMRPLQDAAAFRQWACERSIRAVLHGHKHQMPRPGVQAKGMLVLNGGSSTRPPFRARLLDLLPEGARSILEVELPS